MLGRAAAALRQVVGFDQRVGAEVGHGVEVQVEGRAGQEGFPGQVGVPAGQQAGDFLRGDARGIFRNKALFRHGVEATEQTEALIGDQGHDVAIALDGPELERQRSPQRVAGGDRAGAGQLGALGQCIAIQPDQVGDEEEEPAESGGKLPRAERETTHIGHGLGARADAARAFLIQAAWQGSKPLGGQHLPHRRAARAACLAP